MFTLRKHVVLQLTHDSFKSITTRTLKHQV